MARILRIAVPGPETATRNYVNALKSLGAQPVLTRPGADPAGFDGLLLPGGGDIDPVYYHEEMNGSQEPDPELDKWQMTTLDTFVRARKPVMGICRGHQMINIYFGGTLVQDLPNASSHARDPGSDEDKVHGNTAEPGSFIADLYGTCFPTNSSHHQSIKTPGEGIVCCQTSADGVPEALYHRELPIIAVQWHPERMCFKFRRPDTVDGSLVLNRFLQLCRECPD